jgi:hypothetical protein
MNPQRMKRQAQEPRRKSMTQTRLQVCLRVQLIKVLIQEPVATADRYIVVEEIANDTRSIKQLFSKGAKFINKLFGSKKSKSPKLSYLATLTLNAEPAVVIEDEAEAIMPDIQFNQKLECIDNRTGMIVYPFKAHSSPRLSDLSSLTLNTTPAAAADDKGKATVPEFQCPVIQRPKSAHSNPISNNPGRAFIPIEALAPIPCTEWWDLEECLALAGTQRSSRASFSE